MILTAEALAEALCAAMPHDGGGSRLVYEEALEAAQKALEAVQGTSEPTDEYRVKGDYYIYPSLEKLHEHFKLNPTIERRTLAGEWKEI